MSRKDEYMDILKELDHTPAELEYTLTRAKAKIKFKKRHRFFTIPLSSIATFLIVFTIVANSSITFIQACSRIPVLKDFAQLLTFSPSLSAAIENEYVQPIKLEQVQNNITARIEYVIVDQKQLNIFYSLDSKMYFDMATRPEIKALDGEDLEGYSLSSSSLSPNGELNHIKADFVDVNMSNGIELILKVSDRGNLIDEEPVNVIDDLLTSRQKEIDPDYISEFNFKLEFDPYYTEQGETITLNQEFEIYHQILTATTIEIYPTHIRLNFIDDKDNTAWLKSLDFYLENEKGERYEGISNGISATGAVDSPMMASHRVESNFFSKSKNLTLHIMGVRWLDKDMEKIRLDLENKIIDRLPQGATLQNIRQVENSWILEFSSKMSEGGRIDQLWDWDYYDEVGNAYSINGYSSHDGDYYNEETQEHLETPGRYYVQFALVDYPNDIVYLSPSYSRVVDLPSSISIKIK